MSLAVPSAESRVEPHRALGQGARLVRAEHVHAAEVLDRRQPLHDHFRARHPPRAAGEIDADDDRQELGHEADGQGEGKHEGFDHRTVEEHVDREDGQDQEGRDPQEQVAEAVEAALELGFRWMEREAGRDLAEFGGAARAHDDGPRRARDDVGTEEQSRRAPGEGSAGRRRARPLLRRPGFPGESRLVDEEVLRLQEEAVGGHQGSGVQGDDVAGDDVVQRHLLLPAVAQDRGPHRDHGEELLHRVGRAPLLPEAQEPARDEDDQDDDRVVRLVHGEGQHGGEGEHQDQRAGELPDQDLERGGPTRTGQPVGPEGGEPRCGHGRGEALGARRQAPQDLAGREAPERALRVEPLSSGRPPRGLRLPGPRHDPPHRPFRRGAG